MFLLNSGSAAVPVCYDYSLRPSRQLRKQFLIINFIAWEYFHTVKIPYMRAFPTLRRIFSADRSEIPALFSAVFYRRFIVK